MLSEYIDTVIPTVTKENIMDKFENIRNYVVSENNIAYIKDYMNMNNEKENTSLDNRYNRKFRNHRHHQSHQSHRHHHNNKRLEGYV